jgi:surfactin synthase thioesterase subunit/acyl carrier protein
LEAISSTPSEPIAVEEVQIWASTPERGWAWVRRSAAAPDEAEAVGRFDIDLCDELGQVCVRLTAFSMQALEVAPVGDLLEEAQTKLTRIVSEKLKVPVEEIDLDSEFSEYGFDSISFTLFIHELNKRFGLELLPTIGFEYPTLGKLARHLVDAHTERMAAYFTSSGISTGVADSAGTVDKAAKSPWFALRRHNDAAKLKLFCLPYAIGGGASVFHGWQECLPDDIEVCPIQLPGRESRLNEQPYDDLDTCVEALCEVLSDELDRPYAFYGHSGGGLIAYRLAFRLNQIHGRKPSHLFVGAYPSPGIQPNPMMERLHERFADAGFDNIFEPNDLLNASEAIQKNKMDALESVMAPLQINAELYKAWLPSIIADRKMLQSYSWDGVRFDLPVTVFHGRDDEVVREEEMKAWEAITSGSFVYNQVAGDHLFIRDERILHRVVKHIGRKLLAR